MNNRDLPNLCPEGAMEIEAIFFDVGNVLFKLDWHHTIRLLNIDSTPQKLQEKIGNWETYIQYEKGQLSSETFFKALVERLNLPIAPEKLPPIWNSSLPDLVDGVEAVLKTIPKNIKLCTLSNTNQCHEEHFTKWKIFENFTEIFTSNSLHARKPDSEIFIKAMNKLQMAPEKILFIDDLKENLDAARKLNIHAELCDNSSERLQEIINRYI